MSVNKAILVGRLGRDPETRFSGGGSAICNFSVATDESFKDKNGERQKRTEWHKIVCFGKPAEISQEYLKKGALVYIEGRIQTREWEDKRDGTKRTSTEIVANVMRMLGGKKDGTAPQAAANAPAEREPGADVDPMGPDVDESDIPF